jgi:hypothetical protein
MSKNINCLEQLSGIVYIRPYIPGIPIVWNRGLYYNSKLIRCPLWFKRKMPTEILKGVLLMDSIEELNWNRIKLMIYDIKITGMTICNRIKRLEQLRFHFGIEKVKYTCLNQINTTKIEDLLKENKSGIRIYTSKGDKYEYTNKNTYYGIIIDFIEGTRRNYTKLGKFKCKSINSNKIFYCKKGIPDHIRNMYKFKNTQLIFQEPNSLQKGDIIKITSEHMIKDGLVPQDPYFVNLQSINL